MESELRHIVEACEKANLSCVLGVDPALLASPALLQTFKERGYQVIHVDASRIESSEDLLAALSKACQFAEPVHNWTELEEALCDLAWTDAIPSGFVFLYLDPLVLGWNDLGRFLSVMKTSKMVWHSRGRPFMVLVPEHRLAATDSHGKT
jgi:hypothetical protein